MLSDIAKAALEILKLAPRFLAALAFAASVLLFSSERLLDRLGLTEFVQKWKFALGLTLVVSTALLVVHIVVYLQGSMKRCWRKRQSENRVIDRLHRLTEDEKQILRYYIAKKTRSNTLRVEDGVVQELARAGVIFRSADIGNLLEGFAYSITEVAWEYLNLDPGLLEGTTNTYRTDRRR